MLEVTPFRYEDPLPVGEPLVDREAELQALSELRSCGAQHPPEAPRRYGKTSLLKHLIGELAARGGFGVYVDLYGVVSAAEVIARIERALRAAKLPRSQARWLEPRLRASTRSASVRMGPLSLARSAPAGPPGSTEPGALQDRFAIFAELRERVEAPVIVVLDEFQAVLVATSKIDATIRSEIQHHDRVGYIFAGSHVGMMRELFSDRARPFYAQAPPVALGPLPAEPLAEYVSARFERGARDCRHVLGLLLDVARGHPQRSMMLAAHLFARTAPGETADEATFEEALAGALREADGELHGRWDALTVSQRRAIAALASGQAPFSRAAARQHGTSKGATGNALTALADAGDIAPDPDAASGWAIIDPLMQEWLRRRGD